MAINENGVSSFRNVQRRRKEGVNPSGAPGPERNIIVDTEPVQMAGGEVRERFDPRTYRRGGMGLAAPAGAPVTPFTAQTPEEASKLIVDSVKNEFDNGEIDSESFDFQVADPEQVDGGDLKVEAPKIQSPQDQKSEIQSRFAKEREALLAEPARMTKQQDLQDLSDREKAELEAVDAQQEQEKQRLIDEQTDLFMQQDPNLSYYVASERAKKSLALQTQLPDEADKISTLTEAFGDPGFRSDYQGFEAEKVFKELGSVSATAKFLSDVLAMPENEVDEQITQLRRNQNKHLSDDQFEEITEFDRGNTAIETQLERMASAEFSELEERVLSGEASQEEQSRYISKSADHLSSIKAGLDQIAKLDFDDNMIRKTMLKRYIDDPRTGERVRTALQSELDRLSLGTNLVELQANIKENPAIFDRLDKATQTELLKAGMRLPVAKGDLGDFEIPEYGSTEDLPITHQALLDFAMTRKASDAFEAIEDPNKYELAEQMRQNFREKVSQYDDYFDAFMMHTPKGTGVSDQDMQFIIRPLQNAMLKGDTWAVKQLTRAAILGVENRQNDWQNKNSIMALIADFHNKAKQLQDEGVDTGFFEGGIENMVQRFGSSTDPRLAELGAMADIILTDYIKDTSGTAVSDAERRTLKTMLPSIAKNAELNQSKINAFMNALVIKRDMPLKTLLGDRRFEELFTDSFNDGTWVDGSIGFVGQAKDEAIVVPRIEINDDIFNQYMQLSEEQLMQLSDEELEAFEMYESSGARETSVNIDTVTKNFAGRPVTLAPEAMTAFEKANEEFKAEFGQDIKIGAVDTSSTRTQEQQFELYGLGRTKEELRDAGVPEKYAKPNEVKRTWTTQSRHVAGHAIDLFPLEIEVGGKTYQGKAYADLVKPFLEKYGIMQQDAGKGDYVNFEFDNNTFA